jgi:hypothetical protein
MSSFQILLEPTVKSEPRTIYKSRVGFGQLVRVTRARVSEIMDLLLLAPGIQEDILFLPAMEAGDDPVTERELRRIVAIADWKKQHRLWRRLNAG